MRVEDFIQSIRDEDGEALDANTDYATILRGKGFRTMATISSAQDANSLVTHFPDLLPGDLMLIFSKAGGGPGSGRTSDADVIKIFQENLRSCGVQHAQKYLVDRCIKRLWPSVLAATREGSDPADARLVYDDAKVLIGSETYAALVSQAHISINGAWIEGRVTLLTAVDLLNGALLVVKVLPRHEERYRKAALGERGALEDLNLSDVSEEGPLVRMELLEVTLTHESASSIGVGSGKYEALKMRRFSSALSGLPQLSDEILLKGGRRLQEALSIMHRAGRIHCDVKADNVLLVESGEWYLSDYGASVRVDEKVWSCSEQWYPGVVGKAEDKLDWGMLVVLLLVERRKREHGAYILDQDVTLPKASLPKVLQACMDVPHADLRVFLEELVDLAGWKV